ncbi:MAG: hypothetical protein WKF92_00625 [Pyrinomonadaceae bacterium]
MSDLAEPPKLDKCICGGEAGLNFERTPETRARMYWVQCGACGATGSGHFPNSHDASTDWNTKPENFPVHLYETTDIG